MAGTILFGIDVESANEHTAGFIRYGVPLFEELGVPVTWYVTGRTMERYPELFRQVEGHPLIELQAHTYDHILLKSIWIEIPPGKVIHDTTGHFLKRGESLEVIDADLRKCQQVFQDTLGRRAIGLTAPWGYYRGLADRPDILEIVHEHGFRYLRSFSRNETDGQPVPMEWRPFLYKEHGRGDMAELLVHDYQDDFLWEMFCDHAPTETYADHMMRMVDRVAAEDLVWSTDSHDHGTATPEGFAKKGDWYRCFVSHAKAKGIRFMTGTAYYEGLLRGDEGR